MLQVQPLKMLNLKICCADFRVTVHAKFSEALHLKSRQLCLSLFILEFGSFNNMAQLGKCLLKKTLHPTGHNMSLINVLKTCPQIEATLKLSYELH